MGRRPCCSREGLNRGAWSALEDKILGEYIEVHGEGRWRNVPKLAGLNRCGKSCRLRWLNYLRPNIKRGNISRDEEELIIRLHKLLGNRWSLIAGRLPGRTDNEIKNYWNTNLGKRPLLQDHHHKKSSSNPSNDKIKRPPSTGPSPAATGSRVIRTNAVRCTKAAVDPQPHKFEDPETNTAAVAAGVVPVMAMEADTLNFGENCVSDLHNAHQYSSDTSGFSYSNNDNSTEEIMVEDFWSASDCFQPNDAAVSDFLCLLLR